MRNSWFKDFRAKHQRRLRLIRFLADYHFDSFAKIFETTRMALEPTCFFAYFFNKKKV
jgi:hypothetical protein